MLPVLKVLNTTKWLSVFVCVEDDTVQAFQWIFCGRVINRPWKEAFGNSAADLLPVLGFLGGLYNFCNFVIIFSLM